MKNYCNDDSSVTSNFCTRQAYNGGTPKGGTCSRSANGLNAKGEPNMTVQ